MLRALNMQMDCVGLATNVARLLNRLRKLASKLRTEVAADANRSPAIPLGCRPKVAGPMGIAPDTQTVVLV